jgi:hypothetical protein
VRWRLRPLASKSSSPAVIPGCTPEVATYYTLLRTAIYKMDVHREPAWRRLLSFIGSRATTDNRSGHLLSESPCDVPALPERRVALWHQGVLVHQPRVVKAPARLGRKILHRASQYYIMGTIFMAPSTATASSPARKVVTCRVANMAANKQPLAPRVPAHLAYRYIHPVTDPETRATTAKVLDSASSAFQEYYCSPSSSCRSAPAYCRALRFTRHGRSLALCQPLTADKSCN